MTPFPINRRQALHAALALGTFGSTARAQPAYPSRPVRTLLPFSAGSGPDAVMRQVGDKLSQAWGQQVLVDNKPGANGWLAIGEARRAAPDGYTLLQVAATHMALQPNLYKQMPFDPARDFEPVAALYATNFFVVVGANAPWKNLNELVASAKARADGVTYGSWGMGSEAHLGSAMLEAATGSQMRHIPFKELPQLYTAVATGEVDWAFGTAATVAPLYKAKKLRLLAYAAPRRMPGYAEVPTVEEAAGLPGFEVQTWVALFGPKGLPRPVVEQVHASVAKALAEPDVRERFASFGFEPWLATPAEIARAAEADKLRYAAMVKRAKVSLD